MKTPPRPTPVITSFIKEINGIVLVLWDYTARAGMYESFTMYSDDYAEYTPVRFEKL